MKRYVKYIAYHMWMPFLVITLTLTGILWLTQSLRFVDLIVNRGLGVGTFLYISMLIVPSLLTIIIPIAIFCASILVYNRLNTDSELLVLKSAGLSRIALIYPALFVSGCAVLFSYLLTLYIAPAAYREYKDTQAFVRDNYAAVLLQEGVFSTPVKGLTVYIDSRRHDGLLEGILVHDSRDAKKPVTLIAQSGRLIQTPYGPRFDLINGNRQEIGQNGNLSVLYFDRYALDISVYAKHVERDWREPEERFLNELFWPKDPYSLSIKDKLRAEGHHRLVWPLMDLSLTLIALSTLLSGQFDRRGQWKRILFASGLAVTTLVLDLTFKNLIITNPGLAFLSYLNPILACGISFYCLYIPHNELLRITSSCRTFWQKYCHFIKKPEATAR